MRYRFTPMSDDDARAIAGWRYPAPYDFYDMQRDPEDLLELLNPDLRAGVYWSVRNERGELVGIFTCLVVGSVAEIGLGLHPKLTGRGLGLGFLLAGLAFARQKHAPTQFRLQVAAFNKRAIRVYERAGFVRTHSLIQRMNGGEHEFIEMVRDA